MKKYYNFDVEKAPNIIEVGGKAESLIKLTRGGFNVPPGSVLTVSFFSDWIKNIVEGARKHKPDSAWTSPEAFGDLAKTLKALAEGLVFTEEQKSIIYAILKTHGEGNRFAVRSSSPEEDLNGASFAGGYETVLGVTKDTVLDAVKEAFVSCLDERVFFYKHQNGFDTSNVRIAVIIQRQINSSSSGVGFSLNPINNCFDEAVINANTGLGESVVSGMVTPDEYVVNKPNLKILDKRLGTKDQAIILDPVEGTKVVEGLKSEYALRDEEVLRLTDLISETETYYGFPVDVEWAYEKDVLYLLQSRPITTYVPLPEEMQTQPSEQPILYMDASLVKQGISTPITVLGGDCIAITQAVMFEDMMGKDVSADIKGGMATTRGGRIYFNVSSTVKFQGMDRFLNAWTMVDVSTVELIKASNLDPYIPDRLPDGMKGALWGAIKNNIGTVGYVMRAMRNPDKYKAWYQPYEDAFDSFLKNVVHEDISLAQAPVVIITKYIDLLGKMLPMTYAAEISRKGIRKQLDKKFNNAQERMQYLERSLPDNITIDMGMMMYALSQMPEIKNMDLKAFRAALETDKVSSVFLSHWKDFIDKFGCRTTKELDVGVPRASENVEELYLQIKGMSAIDPTSGPKSIYEKSRKQREQTFEELRDLLSAGEQRKLGKQYNALVKLGGKREALKYWYIRSLAAIRTIILKKAETLVQKGLLDSVDDIFWLHLDQADQAMGQTRQVVMDWIKENKAYFSKLDQVNQFPKLIDSRGRILTMPRLEAKEGELIGQPISPGLVQGRVKVLRTPDEKPLLPGEIMVTRATDPGWTPLFINASAILLEVGGLLQHGALVAREYGKPCVAGITDIMNVLEDGQLVEVDATRGIVRILEKRHETGA